AEPLASVSPWARQADPPSTAALVERCHPLLDLDGDAERHYLAALKLHEASFEQARTQLLYGAWLRRARRKADARTPPPAPLDSPARLDPTPWAERPRAELRATGATIPRPGRTSLPRLTPQELQ